MSHVDAQRSAAPSDLEILERTLTEHRLASRDEPWCVYLLLREGRVVYVGSTRCFEARIGQHLESNDPRVPRKTFDRVLFLRLPASDVLHYEGALARAFRPEFNGSCPGDKGRDAEILAGLGLGHLIPTLRPFGRGGDRSGRRVAYP